MGAVCRGHTPPSYYETHTGTHKGHGVFEEGLYAVPILDWRTYWSLAGNKEYIIYVYMCIYIYGVYFAFGPIQFPCILGLRV